MKEPPIIAVTSRQFLPVAPGTAETRTDEDGGCPEGPYPEPEEDDDDDLSLGLITLSMSTCDGCHDADDADRLTRVRCVRCAVKQMTEVLTLTALIMTVVTEYRIQAERRPGNNECEVDSLRRCPKIYTNVPILSYFSCCRKVAS